MRKGILAAGNWIIDRVKIIDSFPDQEKLANIQEEYSSNGGSAYNLLKGLYKLNAPFPLAAIGLIGNDETGAQIIADCAAMGIDTNQLHITLETDTSYTDVMTVKDTGKRTFFHRRGANALLNKKHFDLNISTAKIFHLGYLLLLDKLDIINADGSTAAALLLKEATGKGLITAADVVSETGDRFSQIIPPALPFIDYLFLNEFEAAKLTGISTSANHEIDINGCWKAAEKAIEMGVRQWVVLHFPEGAIAVSKNVERITQPGVQLPAEAILGTVGAGDAFAAGVLFGIHEEKPMQECLQYGVCAAATSLFKPTSSDGILSLQGCLNTGKKYGYRQNKKLKAIL